MPLRDALAGPVAICRRRRFGTAILGFWALLSVACATAPLGGSLPGVDLRLHQPIYVVHQPNDGRGIDRVLADALRQHGFEATAGPASERPADARAVLEYEDRWKFDMRMYLIYLRLDVRTVDTGVLLATAQSYQGSLEAMGDSWEKIAESLVAEMVAGEVGRDEQR
jgi:hypothetical protein